MCLASLPGNAGLVRFNTGTCLLVNIEGYTLVLPGHKGWVCCETGSWVAACCAVGLL